MVLVLFVLFFILHLLFLFFFFFKQKTAYELRISDGSSDVCSSDLGRWASSPSAPSRPGRHRRSRPCRPCVPTRSSYRATSCHSQSWHGIWASAPRAAIAGALSGSSNPRPP